MLEGRSTAGLTPREAIIVDTVRALYRARRLTEAEFARAEAELGRRNLVELVTLAGYYGMIGGILNAFDVDLPPGAASPFPRERRVATFGLVHGAGHGAWCWQRLIPVLEALGHRAWAMDLPVEDPEAGCLRYAEVVDKAIPPADDLVLVGHSLGGLTIPLVAARRPVRKLVFLCALVPVFGRTLLEQAARSRRCTTRSSAATPGASRGRTAPRGSATRPRRATSSTTTARRTTWAGRSGTSAPGRRAQARAVPALRLALGRAGLRPLSGRSRGVAGLVPPRRARAPRGRADRARRQPFPVHLAARRPRRGSRSSGALSRRAAGAPRRRHGAKMLTLGFPAGAIRDL